MYLNWFWLEYGELFKLIFQYRNFRSYISKFVFIRRDDFKRTRMSP